MLSPADLERVRAREPAALELFFETHFDRAYALLFRLSGDRATAEDLAQETFLKIHRALESLDSSRDPWPWIATIATNTFRDHQSAWQTRLRMRSKTIDEVAVAVGLRDSGADPSRTAEARELSDRVQAALRRVPAAARVVVVLHDWQGFSHGEIATMTGRTHASVRQQYKRALATLARVLGAQPS